MSSSLTVEPAKRDRITLSVGTKWILRKHLCEDRTISDVHINAHNVEFLKGVLLATDSEEIRKDCNNLIDMLVKHGELVLNEQF